MRWCLILTLLTVPTAAHAQEDTPDALASPVETTVRATEAPWVLDDGGGAEPWERDTRQRMPGQYYLALVFRGGAMIGNPENEVEGPAFELSGLFDFRFREGGAWHLRAGIAVMARTYRDVATAELDATSPGMIAFRLFPLVVDLAPFLSVRGGADLGLMWVEENVGWLVNVTGEVAVRIADTPIEVGFYGGMTLPDGMGRTGSRLQATLGAVAGATL